MQNGRAHHEPQRDGARFPHLAALDGLRGVAVALVVGYHLFPSLVPGGFLGVDVFFVLSGFLITSLLLDEATATGRVAIGTFYVRRLRRLAPALLLLIAALCTYAAMWATVGELTRLREHSLWTLGYLANWKLIVDGTTYTDVVAGQSPLRHTWSLAIEEQFYLVFPFLLAGLGWALRWRTVPLRRALLTVAVVGATASATWMALLWGDGGDPSRGYFGTDTRAHSLLVGVGLGALLVGRPPRVGRAADLAAVAGPIGAAVLAVAVARSHEDSSWLQHGGFLVVALAVGGIITALERSSWLRRCLSTAPLVALGVVSYGVYLWHWPILVLVDGTRTGIHGPALAFLRLGLTVAAAAASYHFLERPIRRGAVGRTLGRAGALVAPATAAALISLVLVTTFVPARRATPSVQDASQLVAVAARAAVQPDALVTGPIDVVLFGDSVAHTLAGGTVAAFPQFDPWAPSQSPFDPARARLWSVAKPACSYLPGKLEVEGASPADLSGMCGDWVRDLDGALAARPGAAVLVALANDASDRWIDGSTVALGSPAHTALVAALLDQVRAVARAHGGTMDLVALPPRTGSFATQLDEGGRRERLMRAALRSYAAEHRDVRVLDLFEQVCPDGDCRRPASGFDPDWRYDGMHYTAQGAHWVADWLTSQLAPAPGDAVGSGR